MRHKLIYFLLLVFCIPVAARADDASKMAKIQEFFKVAQLDQLSTRSMQLAQERIKTGMVQQLFGVTLNDEQQKRATDFAGKIMKITSDALDWKTLEPEYAKLYADAYTEQQIDDLLSFYKSPTGQAMVEKAPLLMQEANGIVEKRMAVIMPQLQELTKDYISQSKTTTPQAKPK